MMHDVGGDGTMPMEADSSSESSTTPDEDHITIEALAILQEMTGVRALVCESGFPIDAPDETRGFEPDSPQHYVNVLREAEAG